MRLVLWLNSLICLLGAMWPPVQGLAVPLPTQLSVNGLGKQQSMA